MEEEQLRAKYEEVLNTEVAVDMGELCKLARNGVVPAVRGQVWKFLLGVSMADKSEELSHDKALQDLYTASVGNFHSVEVARRVREDVRAYCSRHRAPGLLSNDDTSERFTRVLVAFLTYHHNTAYDPPLVHMLGPVVAVLHAEPDMFFCFSNLSAMIDSSAYCDARVNTTLARFLVLFRHTLPELYTHLVEDEEVTVVVWHQWLRYLLSMQLPLSCVLRLWDNYLASEHGLQLHTFVCLAVLERQALSLLELDDTDLVVFLNKLPPMDMDRLISRAHNIMENAANQQLLSPEPPPPL